MLENSINATLASGKARALIEDDATVTKILSLLGNLANWQRAHLVQQIVAFHL